MKHFKNIIVKSICLILAFAMVLPMCSFAATDPSMEGTWEMAYYLNDYYMPMQPKDKLICNQNPPGFTWGNVPDVEAWELEIARDKEFTDIVYHNDKIIHNAFTPQITLDTGISLYWRVRYYQPGQEVSLWSKVREFKISGDATPFDVPDIEVLLDRIPQTHPRILATPDTLDELRDLKNKSEWSKRMYDIIIGYADSYVKSGEIKQEPVRIMEFESHEAMMADRLQGQTLSNQNVIRAYWCAFAYLLTGERKYGEFARDLMLEYLDWDYLHGHSSYEYNEQIARIIVYEGTMVYDWIYDILTPTEREQYLEMMALRMDDMFKVYAPAIETYPLNSMAWTGYSYLVGSAVAMYGEHPKAEEILRRELVEYISLYPNWSYQDGGWSQGTAYCWWSTQSATEPLTVLATTGVINLFDKAWSRKNYAWNLYQHTYRDKGNFGDGTGQHDLRANMAYNAVKDIHFIEDDGLHGVRKYLAEKAGGIGLLGSYPLTYIMGPAYEKAVTELPYSYPHAYKFEETGYISMHSDLVDYNEIQMSFRSSQYGTYSHCHPDMNGFYLSAYGKALARHSGTYDAFGTDHHLGVVRQTFAHNTITVDNKGQADSDINSKGEITGFLHQQEFDLAMGDGTKAYKNALGYFERSILYLRPDQFVVIDDLKARPNLESRFQWWLNAEKAIQVYDTMNGAKINLDGAVLDTTIQYPENPKIYYSDVWSGPDMIEHLPQVGNSVNTPPHSRVWFETELVPETKIIATLDVHTESNEARYVEKTTYDDHIKLSFENGTIVYVNMGEPETTVETTDGFIFSGRALAHTDESIMLVKGTFVKQGEVDIITSDREVSVVVGRDELSISAVNDTNISINTDCDYVDGITSVTDFNGNEILPYYGLTYKKGRVVRVGGTSKNNEAEKPAKNVNRKLQSTVEIKTTDEGGAIEKKEAEAVKINFVEDENFMTFTTIKSDWQLMLNGKKFDGETLEGSIDVYVDDEVKKVPTVGYMSRTGYESYTGEITLDGGKYIVEEISEGLQAGSLKQSEDVVNISNIKFTSDYKDGVHLKLKSVMLNKCEVETLVDFEAAKESMTVFKEAEDFATTAFDATVYDTRSFLSGGKGLSNFDTPDTVMTWDIEVPETGEYKLAIKYVAWQPESLPSRLFYFNDKVYYSFVPELTESYGASNDEWRVCLINKPIHLEKGKNTLSIEAINGGMWNLDWLGLIKQ